jgi:hypothetical protein
MKDLPQIIDAMGMIGMVMGQQHGIEPADAGGQQLFAQIRAGIDQDGVASVLDQQRHPAPTVFRVVRVAGTPIPCPIRAADARNAA